MFQTPGLSRKRVRASLSDISSLEDIEGLSVRQLKEILACNFVNYSGCCEKWELVEKVSRLYRESEENHKTRRFIFNSHFLKTTYFLVSSGWFCQQEDLVCNLFCSAGTTGKWILTIQVAPRVAEHGSSESVKLSRIGLFF